MSTMYGFRWSEDELFTCRIPRWTVEPSLEAIAQIVKSHFSLDSTQDVDVSFLAQGSFNKVYKIHIGDQVSVFRVSLPLFAPLKVSSEVATSRFMRDLTSIPVPMVHAFDPTCDNVLRFPWILMDFVPGEPARVAWRYLAKDKKEHFVRQLAIVHARLFDRQFRSIGSLRQNSSSDGLLANTQMPPGVVVAIAVCVFLGMSCCPGITLVFLCVLLKRLITIKHLEVHVDMLIDHDAIQSNPQPAFDNTRRWLAQRLMKYREDLETQHASSIFETEEDRLSEVAYYDGEVDFIARLLKVLPLLYGASDCQEPTMLSPRDLHADNIMVDRAGNITGLLDWEFTATAPLWEACQPPKFFSPGRWAKQDYSPGMDDPDGEPDEDYYEDMRQWEMKIRYRELFLEMMADLQPRWAAIYRAAEVEREFEEAINDLEVGWGGPRVDSKWLGQVEANLDSRGPFDPNNPRPVPGVQSRSHDWL